MNVGLIKLEALSWRLVKTAVPHDPTIIRFDSIHGRTHRLSLRRALRPVASLRIAGGGRFPQLLDFKINIFKVEIGNYEVQRK